MRTTSKVRTRDTGGQTRAKLRRQAEAQAHAKMRLQTAIEPAREGVGTTSKALAVLDGIHRKLAAITTVVEAKKFHDEVAAIQHYLKCQRAELAVQNKAALFKFLAERRMGELLLTVPKVQGKRGETDGLLLTIKRSGFTEWTAYRWMALAKVPESELRSAAASCDTECEELTSRLVYEVVVRRWELRRGAPESTQEGTAPGADDLSLAQAKRDLEEWEILEPGALVGLSNLEARTIVIELRNAYELYCEDPARGKVPTWGNEVHAEDLRRASGIMIDTMGTYRTKTDPSTWKRDDGWYPPFTIDRKRLRVMGQEIINDLLVGAGGGYDQVSRRLDLAARLCRQPGRGESEFPEFSKLVAALAAIHAAAEMCDEADYKFPPSPWRLSMVWPGGFTVGVTDHRLVVEMSDEDTWGRVTRSTKHHPLTTPEPS
jgi:hypothetical protein